MVSAVVGVHDPSGLEARDDLLDDVADLIELLFELFLSIPVVRRIQAS
jgi:hypothetical protein